MRTFGTLPSVDCVVLYSLFCQAQYTNNEFISGKLVYQHAGTDGFFSLRTVLQAKRVVQSCRLSNNGVIIQYERASGTLDDTVKYRYNTPR